MNTTLKRIVLVSILAASACGPSGRHGDDTTDAKPADAPCPTTVSGKVFAPNGTLPLYNVTVYVPEAEPTAFPEGVQCAQCSTHLPGGAITKTTSDSSGNFKLENVPPGNNIPIVVTTGKWLRKTTIPFVATCVDNPVQDGTVRLPKNRNEGFMPRIAVVTGGCDPLGCILSKLGIEASEFGDSSAGPQRVVWYNGGSGQAPGAPQAAPTLWTNLDELKKFDLVINSCECSENLSNKGAPAPDMLRQYADMGGRVFGSHFHYIWQRSLVSQWVPTATWSGGISSTPDLVDQSHPNGMALAQWLVAVGASTTPGQIQLGTKTNDVSTVNPPTTRWLHSSGQPATTHYLSFNTPVGALPAQQCGKVVYAGMHVASGSVSSSFPSGCSAGLTPDEKALVFLLFDLQTCVDIIL